MSSSTSGRGQYREIADAIRTAIERGEYPRGQLLPTEDQLAENLGVHRITVNRALKILLSEGLVRVRRGKGTFVNELPPIMRNATARYSKAARERDGSRGAFDSEVRALGREPKSELHVDRVSTPPDVAEILGVEAGQVVVRARRMSVDDVPVQIANSYIPLDIAEGTALAESDSGSGGIISRFAELGHAQVRISERIRVRPPTTEEAGFLRMSEDQRVYEITHTGWTADDRAVEVCVHVMPTHQWVLEYEWPADGA